MVTNFRAMFVSLGEFLDPFSRADIQHSDDVLRTDDRFEYRRLLSPEDTLALTIRTPGKSYSLSPRALEGREKGLHPPRGVACQMRGLNPGCVNASMTVRRFVAMAPYGRQSRSRRPG